jgi:hypothetical protein
MSRRPTVVILALILGAGACTGGDPDFNHPLDPDATAGNTIVLVDDFESSGPANLLGNQTRIFLDASSAALILAERTTRSDEVARGSGALKIVFDVLPRASDRDPFGGFVEPLAREDCPSSAPGYDLGGSDGYLAFDVRLAAEQVNMEIALKDVACRQTTPKRLVRQYLPTGTSWSRIRIPVRDLLGAENGMVDIRHLREINLGFANLRFNNEGSALTGTVFVDQFSFER